MRRESNPRPTQTRINRAIRAETIRLIGVDGKQVGVISRTEALALAEADDLDLVEIGGDSDPVVCKLMNYSKMRFEAEREARKKRHKSPANEVKEVQLRPAIDLHDLKTKAGAAGRFLTKGHRVRVVVVLHGRHLSRPEVADTVLERFFAEVDGNYVVESQSRSGRRVVVQIKPAD